MKRLLEHRWPLLTSAGLLLYSALSLLDLAQPAPAVGFDATEHLAEADVATFKDGRWTPCKPRGYPEGFRCARTEWSQVSLYAGYGGGQGRKCLWMHPHAPGVRTKVTWRDLPLGAEVRVKATLLHGSGPGGDVTTQVLLDDRTLGAVTVNDPWDSGDLIIPLKPGAAKGTLSLQVRAPKSQWRKMCVSLHMTGQRPGQRRGGRAKAVKR